jgi:FKBP-type peptidyl-prolyl cis-trans isomerase
VQWPSAGLLYRDYAIGEGETPKDGQQATFAYTAYNESGGLIDSTYRKGQDAVAQLGTKGLIPGMRLPFLGGEHNLS